MRAVLLDLDDTLYREMDFVLSGFRAAAAFLGARTDHDPDAVVQRLREILNRDGRGRVFDALLAELGLADAGWVPALVHAYRTHQPAIAPFPGALDLLQELRARGVRLGIVTDGLASVQWRKLRALGLPPLVDVVVCTQELGESFAKPSPVPFAVALEILKVDPGDALYVGDDLRKDFLGPRELGMRTARVPAPPGGLASGVPEHPEADADVLLDSLNDLPSLVVP